MAQGGRCTFTPKRVQLTRIEGVGQLFGELRETHGQDDHWEADQLHGQLEQRIRILGQALLHIVQQQHQQHIERGQQRQGANVAQIHAGWRRPDDEATWCV